jgi:hypothetical protein
MPKKSLFEMHIEAITEEILENNDSLKEIARQMGIEAVRKMIISLAGDLYIPSHRSFFRQTIPVVWKRLVKQVRDGESELRELNLRRLARDYQINPKTVKSYLHNAGIDPLKDIRSIKDIEIEFPDN